MASHEPSPKRKSIPEAENFGNISSPKPEPESNVEPMPEWNEAIELWGPAWEFHLYGLGTAFLILALLSLVCLTRLSKHESNQRKLSVVLLGFLAMYGASRSLFLFVDAYHHKNTIPMAVLNIIWGIAQPCLITSYTLLFVVLLNALRLKQRFQTWFTSRNLAFIIVPHFLFVFGAELIISFFPQFKTLVFLCQFLYAFFSLSLALLYTSVSIYVWNMVNKAKNNTVTENNSRKKIRRILYTCVVAATGGAMIGMAQIYTMAGPFSVFSSTSHAPAWPWYSLTTVMRLLEIYMASVLFFIAHHQSSNGSGSIRKVKVCSVEQNTTGQKWAVEKI